MVGVRYMICHWATNRTDSQNLLSMTLDVPLQETESNTRLQLAQGPQPQDWLEKGKSRDDPLFAPVWRRMCSMEGTDPPEEGWTPSSPIVSWQTHTLVPRRAKAWGIVFANVPLWLGAQRPVVSYMSPPRAHPGRPLSHDYDLPVPRRRS